LAELAPEHVDIEDESALHAGHAGARSGGGHYRLTIVSPRFTGLSRLERQRLIYSTLGELMQTRIHALAIRALSPEEI
jgi:BolA protein